MSRIVPKGTGLELLLLAQRTYHEAHPFLCDNPVMTVELDETLFGIFTPLMDAIDAKAKVLGMTYAEVASALQDVIVELPIKPLKDGCPHSTVDALHTDMNKAYADRSAGGVSGVLEATPEHLKEFMEHFFASFDKAKYILSGVAEVGAISNPVEFMREVLAQLESVHPNLTDDEAFILGSTLNDFAIEHGVNFDEICGHDHSFDFDETLPLLNRTPDVEH